VFVRVRVDVDIRRRRARRRRRRPRRRPVPVPVLVLEDDALSAGVTAENAMNCLPLVGSGGDGEDCAQPT
jgi:hypothetical protein